MPIALLPLLVLPVTVNPEPVSPDPAAPAAPNAATRPVRFDPFVLEDQFGRTHSVGGASDGVLVLLYGDRGAAEPSRELGAALHVLFHPTAAGKSAGRAADAPVRPIPGMPAGTPAPPVRVVPGACATGVPRPIRAMVNFELRRAAPHTPVWMDWDGTLDRLFGLSAGRPNAVVISPDGLAYRVDVGGRSAVADVERVVESLRRRAVAGGGS